MRLKLTGLIAALALLGFAPQASAAIVTFLYSGKIDSSYGPGSPPLGSSAQATITFDSSAPAIGTPFGPALVDYNAIIRFSINAYQGVVDQQGYGGIRVFDNYFDGKSYIDGILIDAADKHVSVVSAQYNITSGPSQLITSTNLPTSPFDLSSLTDRSFSILIFNPDNTQTRYGFTITSASLAPAVPEPSTWAMLLLGFTGIGTVTWRRRKAGLRAV